MKGGASLALPDFAASLFRFAASFYRFLDQTTRHCRQVRLALPHHDPQPSLLPFPAAAKPRPQWKTHSLDSIKLILRRRRARNRSLWPDQTCSCSRRHEGEGAAPSGCHGKAEGGRGEDGEAQDKKEEYVEKEHGRS